MSVRIERYGEVEPLTPRFTRFLVERLGAKSLDAIQAPTELRADYTCLNGLAAIELKTLKDDGSLRISNLTGHLEERSDWPVFYGSWPFQSVLSNLTDPETVRRQMYDRIGRAIVDHLRKANKQLRAHVKDFPRKNVVRIVILLNEDHEIYSPEMVTYLVQQALARTRDGFPRYESIDAVLFITERHATVISKQLAFPIAIVLGQTMDDTAWKQNVVDRVADGWSAWNNVPTIEGTDIGALSFSTIEPISNQMRRQDLWLLQYRRRPYMDRWTDEQIRSRWDEVVVLGIFSFLLGPPIRPSKTLISKNMQHMTHLIEEFGKRGIPISTLDPTQSRLVEAAKRITVPEVGVAWLIDYLANRKID
jgi:hypothetical protein